MRKIAAVSVAFAALVTGCLTDPTELGAAEQEVGGCPKFGCGENSPRIEVWDFHELDEAGQPNDADVRIIDMVKGAQHYAVDVVGDRLTGVSSVGTLQGVALENAAIRVNTPQGIYEIKILKVSQSTQFWIGPPAFVESYRLAYTKLGSGQTPRDLCPNPPRSRLDPAGGLWGSTVEALVFTGDRYDALDRTVTHWTTATSGTWFNIGCAGSAIAKLHLNRHTTASQTSVYQTQWYQRQAMLKMYASDVCAAGEAFTYAGTPLHYANRTGWFSLTGMEASIEGYWGASGAVCLENHRLAGVFGADIAFQCPSVPTCSALIPGFPAGGWPRGAHFITANP